MPFSWCGLENRHEHCIREYRVFYIDPRTNKPVYTGDVRSCECRKRGCKCYVKPADRDKPVKKRARKK